LDDQKLLLLIVGSVGVRVPDSLTKRMLASGQRLSFFRSTHRYAEHPGVAHRIFIFVGNAEFCSKDFQISKPSPVLAGLRIRGSASLFKTSTAM